MKRKTIAALIAVLTIGMSTSVWAAQSISQIIPEAPKTEQGTLSGGQTLVVKNADPASYKNETVTKAVEKFNDDKTVVTVTEFLSDLGVDTKTEEIKTTTGTPVIPSLYESLTPVIDLDIEENGEMIYETSKPIKATITVEAVKGMDKKDILLMVVDPVTKKPSFISPEEFNSETGEITATFPTLGALTVLKTAPICTTGVNPDKYENKEAGELATELAGKQSVEFADFFKSSDEDTSAIEIADGVTINADDYSSAMELADLAIKSGDDYIYTLEGSVEVDAHRDLGSVDWKRIAQNAKPDFDVTAAEADPSLLTELGTFTIPGSFIVQINPETGEKETIYEPELSFTSSNSEEVADDDTDGVRQSWKAADENSDPNTPDLVIHAKFKSMGAFTLVLPKDAQ